MKAQSRHSAPRYIAGGQKPVALNKLQLGGVEHTGTEREGFIQDLVDRHPDVIPMQNIEPAFVDLVSVCVELPTDAGYLDNLWVTPAGGIVLGECKLVKNPQARREVIAQALDYARAMSSWRFEQLEEAVQKARKEPTFKIWSLVSDEVEESFFVDSVERRLRIGQFLILIIGDGIQEGVEALTSHLQLHAGMHAGLALVDLSIWQGLDGGLLIVPRVPMKTVQIERGVVHIDDTNRIQVMPPTVTGASISSKVPQAQTQSDVEFYTQLGLKRPGLPEQLKAFVNQLQQFNVFAHSVGKYLYLRWESPELGLITIAGIDLSGKVWSGRARTEARKVGLIEPAEDYLSATATAANGIVRAYDSGLKEVLTKDGKGVDAVTLVSSDLWMRAIAEFTSKLLASESIKS